MARNTSPIIVEEIRKLSQEEGLKDHEIADIIKYNRVTIQKLRKLNGIPTCNLQMRKDKSVVCPQCFQSYYIRRCEKPGVCCPQCAELINKKIQQDQYCKME